MVPCADRSLSTQISESGFNADTYHCETDNCDWEFHVEIFAQKYFNQKRTVLKKIFDDFVAFSYFYIQLWKTL